MTEILWGYVKREAVLCISSGLALLSMLFVHPDLSYIGYVDFRTLAVLFCLMTVMTGFHSLGVFRWIAGRLLTGVHSLWQLLTLLIMLCFFFSMLITNDVALITFVPLTLTVINMLDIAEKRNWIIPIVVMQTIAANLGSMLTPIGNPQNLYLYAISGMSLQSFLWLMLPYAAITLVMLLLWSFGYCLRSNPRLKVTLDNGPYCINKPLLAMYSVFFVLSLLVVAKVIPYSFVLAFVLVGTVCTDRQTLAKVDYSLLLTFVAFFLFIGNVGRIAAFKELLHQVLLGNEVLTAVVASQLISNVPAALLLSGFTDHVKALIVGTNLGGLGTLIASMASLISYKLVVAYDNQLTGNYLRCFTIYNCGFLVALLAMFAVCSK